MTNSSAIPAVQTFGLTRMYGNIAALDRAGPHGQ